MPNLFFAKEELKFAIEEYEQFKNDKTASFGPNKHWADFLVHLELSFVKAERGCQDIKNGFLPFQGYFKNLRKKDQLLSYLKNARDACQHGTDMLVSIEIAKRVQVDSIKLSRLDEMGNVVETTEHPMYPAEMRLKAFCNNGKYWIPPKQFLGKPLKYKDNPYEVGFLGIKFYEDFINQVEGKFVGTLNK